jgi:DNA-binding HxlR family transcriptional regulator
MTHYLKMLHNMWTLRVVAILRHGPLRFNQIERGVHAPNPPMISHHLKKMVRDGLIERHVIRAEPPANVQFALSPLGQA